MSPQERVRAAMRELGIPGDVVEMPSTTGTAEAAAAACGCELGQIVKTLFFLADGRPTVVLAAGDRQVDTSKLAALVGVGRKKLKMGSPDEVLAQTGYAVGGVSPLGQSSPSDVVVDESLSRFDAVWAAAGTQNAVFRVDTEKLVSAVQGQWANVTRTSND